MPVRVQCSNPECQESYSVSDEAIGRTGRCPKCHRTFELYPTLQPLDDLSDPRPIPPAPSFPSELAVGSTFGRYRIVRELGRGGMGAVYLAQDSQPIRKVALKIPHFSPADGSEAVRRFVREANAAAQLDHPNLCPVFEVSQVNGVHYLTMPFIDGEPLSALLRNGPLPERRAAEIARVLAQALEVAHQSGVIHRDLKPSNVMICRHRGPVVMDFGLVRLATAADSLKTRPGDVLGTPAYMAPEQVLGEIDAIGPATDIYALGVILYQLLTGQLPFQGPPHYVMSQIVHAEVPPPSTHRPGLARELEAIVLKAMARKPADRFGSMADLAEALGEDAGPAVARPEPEPERAPAPERPTLPPRSRQRPWLAVAGFGALLLLGVVLYVVTDRGRVSIDIEEPDSVKVVTIDGREIELEVLGEPLSLRTGKHTLKVWWRDSESQPELFRVRRGDGNPVVTVRYKPKKPPEPPPIAQAEPIKPEPPPIVIEPEESPESMPEPELPAVAQAEPIEPEAPPIVIEPEAPTTEPEPAAVAMVEPEPAPVDQARPAAPPRELKSSIGMTLVRIEPGSFLMGSTEAQIEQIIKQFPDTSRSFLEPEKPQHRVEITRPFYLGVHEVTVGQFRRFVAAAVYKTDAEKDVSGGYGWNESKGQFESGKQYHWRNPGFAQTDDHPVVNVSHNDAVAFCEWLSGQESDRTYRLPTEAEWEYASRAGTRGLWGESDDPESLVKVANVADATARRKYPDWTWCLEGDDGFLYTSPVGSFDPNGFGLYDMIGNVWEWCADGYDASYYASSPAADPPGPSGVSDRVFRGGSWFIFPQYCRPAFRVRDSPSVRNGSLGFRVAAVQ